jgi:hypothetical protein
MKPTAPARNAVCEEPLTLEPLQPSLRVMDWTDEPATEAQFSSLMRLGYHPVRPLTKTKAAQLIRGFEQHTQREQASAENGVRPQKIESSKSGRSFFWPRRSDRISGSTPAVTRRKCGNARLRCLIYT